MHQNLLNAEFASVWYINAKNENVHVIRVIKALTKVLHKSFCCTYACRQLHFLGQGKSDKKQMISGLDLSQG
jgi:hypothetical protein